MALPKRDIEIKTVSNVQDSLGQARSNDGKMVELQHVSEAACNGGRLWHAIWLPADHARYESGPPLATNSPMALNSSRSRCKASLADTRRVASVLDDARASRFSSNAIRGCWTGIARSSIEMSPQPVGSDRSHADLTVHVWSVSIFQARLRGPNRRTQRPSLHVRITFPNTWQRLKAT